ncbi:NAD(P)-binding protein [Staphylococcus succinus]|jgi:precorrin-2 dehydrogenase/sirohydrochlorin ferrochelatase|uniref:precorrin-2 dehydrogenase n=3 Tax=Staphylococcus succinus TaxID=61015 RepID=A0ABX5IQ45_9STAP|nr:MULTISPECIES: NAD(P)-binding protein [Staphylococcus]MDH9159812.1 NAD(P)-binding protein [Staphylococcus succinus]MEB8124044.1 NAD(P)-binding protein [Staphylococcus succinus]MEB8210639.1 NAD(P)-binding protein [Staphylococcus succinus]OIJ31610.1 precorrin-2 dehydrogenase [Staphylococcus sp. LCT-H4]PNZ18231.1 precorrin-2 dehydrogenase [Staphylococcus succinus subsp. succinus]
MPLMPLMIDISKKHIVVVGGGRVAERRIKTLMTYSKDIHVISPTVTEQLQQLIEYSDIKWSEKTFEAKDVQYADLIVVATNDDATNQCVLQSKPSHAMINMASEAMTGDVIFPSIFQRGKLTISISTNGASPGLTAQLLEEFNQRFDRDYETYVDFLYECRQRIKRSELSSLKQKRFLKEILADDYLSHHKQREVRNWLDSVI